AKVAGGCPGRLARPVASELLHLPHEAAGVAEPAGDEDTGAGLAPERLHLPGEPAGVGGAGAGGGLRWGWPPNSLPCRASRAGSSFPLTLPPWEKTAPSVDGRAHLADIPSSQAPRRLRETDDFRGGFPDARPEDRTESGRGEGLVRYGTRLRVRFERGKKSSCTANRASHRPPRAFRKDRGKARPRPGRTAANSASPWRGSLTRLSSTATGGEPMPDPPPTAARGRARGGSSPSSNTAPGFSPTGASRPTPPVL